MEFENELRSALQAGQLFLDYQAIVSAYTQKLVGAEALIRWNHHSGLRKPDDFIPLLEQCQEILDIGDWTIFETSRQGMEWYHAGKPIRISVNVAARQLADAQFAPRVWETAAEETLNDPKGRELPHARGKSAQHRRNREADDSRQKVLATTESRLQPGCQWNHNYVGDEIARNRPRSFVERRPEVSLVGSATLTIDESIVSVSGARTTPRTMIHRRSPYSTVSTARLSPCVHAWCDI